MEVVTNNYLPGDPRLVEQLVYELKSQGIFDQFRKECIADVDTKPAYQNLRQRVEGSVTSFLNQLTWKPDMNKNQLREQLRKSIYESGYLDTGVERIVDQVVNPKINSIFLPQVEDVVYRYLGIEKPNRLEVKKELKIDVTDLLPTDLEAISPESDHTKDDSFNFNDSINSDTKMEEDESPPFEPIDADSSNIHHEENSVDSHLSGFSGLQSHDSNPCMESKICPMELSNQDSQASQNSSESRLSIITSEDNTKMEIREDSNSKLLKSSDSNSQTEMYSLKTQISSDLSLEVKDEATKATDTTDSNSDYNGSVEKSVKKEDEENEAEKPNDVDKKKQVDEKEDEDKKYNDRKSDDKKSRNSDKYSSKDKYRKSSSSSSSREKEKSSSKYSSSSSSKDRDKCRDKKDSRSTSSSSNKDKNEKDIYKNDKSRDKIKSEKDKDKSEKDRERKEKEKEKNERDKTEKSKSVKDKDKSIKDKDKMKSSSSSSSSTSKYNSSSKEKDKNSTNVKSDSSKKDKEKSRSSSTSSKDKSKSNNGDSKSKSSSSDKHKKEDKSTNNVKYSSSSSSSKKDKDKKKDSKKEVKDDHYSSKDKKNDRRSTDRDSNDGRSSKQSQSNSFSESNPSQVQKSSQDSSNSTSGSGSGDSGTSDQSEHVIKLPENTVEHNENKEPPVSYLDTQKFKYIKPKFASNFQEARKLMKIRKQLAKLERQNQLSLAQIEVPTEVSLENGINCMEEDNMTNIAEEKTEENISKENETEDYLTEQISSEIVEIEEPPKDESLVLQSRELSKENWEALEARLAQEMSQVNYNSYESPYDEYDYTGSNSLTTSPQKVLNTSNKLVAQEREEEIVQVQENIVESEETCVTNQTEPETKIDKEENVTVAETEKETDDNREESPPLEDADKKINKPTSELVVQIEVLQSELTRDSVQSEVINDTKTDADDVPQMIVDTNEVDDVEITQSSKSDDAEPCYYLEPLSPHLERNLQFLYGYIEKLEQDVKHSVKTFHNNFVPLKERSGKRKMVENVDLRNNNKAHYVQTTGMRKRRKTVEPNPNSVIPKANKEKLCNSSDISPNDSFSLPLSPAESDKSNEKKEEDLSKAKQKREPFTRSVNARSQRYSSEDLYKPRPTFISSRRSRGAKNLEK